MRKRVLLIGPSPTSSKGGMAAVIKGIQEDPSLKREFDIEIYESYMDGAKPFILIFSIYAFIKFFITKRNYDIYHIFSASRGSILRKSFYVQTAKRWNKAVILHIHGAGYIKHYQKSSSRRKKRISNTMRSADLVLALSQTWKCQFDQLFGLQNCRVLENGIDTEKLHPAISDDMEQHLHSFIMLGRLGKRKGTYDLVEAIGQARQSIPDLKCCLAGDGDIEQIQKIISRLGLENHVKIAGWVDFEEKLSLLKKASTLVLPSYHEGMPMAILEGMACGKGIISTPVGAVPEIISDENGILLDPGDIGALADALIRCSTDLSFVKRMSAANLQKAREQFDIRSTHKKLAKYYRNIVS